MPYFLIPQILMILIWLFKVRHLSLLYRQHRVERRKMQVIRKGGFLLNRFVQIIQILLLISVAISFFGWGIVKVSSPISISVQISGIIFFLIGILMEIRAARNLGSNYFLTPQIRKGQNLIETGPYRFIRHPMYLGEILVFTGFGLALLSYTTFGLTLLVLTPLRNYCAQKEEFLLWKYFGNSFREYRNRTRRFL